jgi:hypothetical protein
VCKIPRGSAKNHITSPTRTLGSITSRTLIRKRNWTNSTIILSWLSSPPPTWKTFITNRVPEIQTLTKPRKWFHVASKENPADIIWRGTSPDQLKDNTLWFNGSKLLLPNNHEWSTDGPIRITDIPDKKESIMFSVII